MKRIFALLLSAATLLAQLPPNLDCRCAAIGGDEYLCKCAVAKSSGGGSTPTEPGKPAPVPPRALRPNGTTSTGQPIYTGPRGGKYHYSASGKKVYERRQ
jgi:hypothetical protein